MQAAAQDQLTRCPLTSQPVARLAQFIRGRVVAKGARAGLSVFVAITTAYMAGVGKARSSLPSPQPVDSPYQSDPDCSRGAS